MSTWIKARGAKIRLVADPNILPNGENTGLINIEYKNRSFVPLTLNILSINSSDQYVASSDMVLNPASVHVPRRPSRYSAFQAATGEILVGKWIPLTRGHATIGAQVNALDQLQRTLSIVNPCDDVQVK